MYIVSLFFILGLVFNFCRIRLTDLALSSAKIELASGFRGAGDNSRRGVLYSRKRLRGARETGNVPLRPSAPLCNFLYHDEVERGNRCHDGCVRTRCVAQEMDDVGFFSRYTQNGNVSHRSRALGNARTGRGGRGERIAQGASPCDFALGQNRSRADAQAVTTRSPAYKIITSATRRFTRRVIIQHNMRTRMLVRIREEFCAIMGVHRRR